MGKLKTKQLRKVKFKYHELVNGKKKIKRKSFYNRSTRLWWGHCHLRIGSRSQVRLNKGVKFSCFQHIGKFIEFARVSRSLRAATLSKCLRRNFWGSDFYLNGQPKSAQNYNQQISKTTQNEGAYIYAVERGKIIPKLSSGGCSNCCSSSGDNSSGSGSSSSSSSGSRGGAGALSLYGRVCIDLVCGSNRCNDNSRKHI
ncbi:hypothetical protein MKS88_002479 [Plasmodium brasilianum]|uniref:Uncharacterized protein n=1 Tax=Plasmodium brasilianum TaxID=5824 RepID=A0ACB9YBW6_PLABR|nr:hypothetical protein MKS88_002479 [Plasmodium brasilianum]